MRIWCLALVVLTAAACEGESLSLSPTVSDSAGVRIVENPTLDVPTWSLVEQPLLDLGTMDEDGPEQFFRVTAVRRLGDRIAVLNSGSRELRIFGNDGGHIGSLGGEGDGPGEFRFPTRMWKGEGDSIVIWDPRLRRVTHLELVSAAARVVAVSEALPNPQILTRLDDGRLILTSEMLDLSNGGAFRTMDAAFRLLDPAGQVIDTLPVQPLGEYGTLGEVGMIGTPLFGARMAASGHGRGYWVGTGRSEEVRHYSPEGALQLIARWPELDRDVGAGDAQLDLDAQLARADEEMHERIQQLHRARPIAEAFPAHGSIIAAMDGGVWVQEYERPTGTGVPWWTVFDSTGVLVGRISVPTSFRMLEIGGDHVLGVFRDEVGVEHVRMHRLLKDAAR